MVEIQSEDAYPPYFRIKQLFDLAVRERDLTIKRQYYQQAEQYVQQLALNPNAGETVFGE